MPRDNYYQTAIANFNEAIAEMKSTGAQYSDKPTWILLHGLQHLAQGLRQSERSMEERLDAIAKALPPPR
jgi:hypothetical protein